MPSSPAAPSAAPAAGAESRPARASSGRRRGGRVALVAAAAALTGWLAWAHLPGRSLWGLGTPATGPAEWIWVAGPHDRRSPVAFYAAREIELDEVPAAAELRVLADEEYHAFVNGRWVGAGAWQPGAPLDVYAVAELLRPGENRILIEVRSARGAGGLLACLLDPVSGRVLAATDPSWATIPRHQDVLFQRWAPLPRAHGTRSWGRPPVGRWGAPEPGPVRPLIEPRNWDHRVPPERIRPLGEPAGWRPFREGSRRLPKPVRGRSGPGYEIDFGEPVEGRLNLRFAGEQGLRTSLLFFGEEPGRFPPLDPAAPAAAEATATPAATAAGGTEPAAGGGGLRGPQAAAIVMPGRPGWSDTAARRFRYVAVVGEAELLEAWMDPPAPWEEPQPAAICRRCEGLLGIEPPPLRTPVQDEVGRQLERFAGVAGR